jgi:Protein of unknown function (DUF3592)
LRLGIAATPPMALRITSGILAATFLPLGVVFTLVGVLDKHPDRGSPRVFVYVGIPFAVAGVACATVFLVLWRREAARRRVRRQGLRTSAEVIRADVNWSVRVNGRPTLKLTVRLPGQDAVSGTFLAGNGPLPAPGARIDVLYDPADPSNFEPVA